MKETTIHVPKQTAEADHFSAIFRAEHRQVRDLLLELVQAYQGREKNRISALLTELASCTGPHFRYEEEVLYPLLVQFFGQAYVRELFHAHDRAIATAKELVTQAGKDGPTEDEVSSAIRGVRSILPHVTDCDGLSILVERLPAEHVLQILAARDKARHAGLDLLTWAAQVRRGSQGQPD